MSTVATDSRVEKIKLGKWQYIKKLGDILGTILTDKPKYNISVQNLCTFVNLDLETPLYLASCQWTLSTLWFKM